MSIVQVVQPSHIQDSIYFVSSAAVLTGVMKLFNLPLQLTVEGALPVIAYASLISVVLIAYRPERHLSQGFVTWLLMHGGHGSLIRRFMGYSILYTRCWQSSLHPSNSISKASLRAIARVIRRPEAHDDIAAVHSFCYFSLAIVPLLYTYGLGLWSWYFGLDLCVGVATLVALRNIDHPERTRRFAEACWLFDLLSEDERRRKDNMIPLAGLDEIYQHQYTKDIASLSRLLQMASTGDWDGFCENFGLFREDYLRVAKALSEHGTFDTCMQDLCIALTLDPGSEERRERIMIAANGAYLVKEAIMELADWTEFPDSTEFVPIPNKGMTISDGMIGFSRIESLIPLLNILRDSLGEDSNNPQLNISGWELYKVLSKETISTLSDNTMNAFLGLPVSLFKRSGKGLPPSWNICSGKFGHERAMELACRLIQAVDSGIWPPSKVLPILCAWKVDIKPLAPWCSCTSLLALLNLRLDLPEDTIRSLIGPAVSTCHREAVDPIMAAYERASTESRTMIESELHKLTGIHDYQQVAQEVLNRISTLRNP